MREIITWSAVDTAAKLRSRDVSVLEVTQAHLERAARENPKINALTVIDETSLDRARAMDRIGPQPDQPLWGVPVTTKCNVDQEGFPNSNGVPAYKDNFCDEDSAVVANLKSSGANIIARTNTPEFSMRWFTSNPLHGVTRNPLNSELTPGGSSGGASAALAVGIGCIGHGNDLGGSLRYPAYCCGIASIKPSMGRVPAVNPGALAERPPLTMAMSVQGPITREVGDLRLALNAMSKRSAMDPLWTAAADSGRMRDGALRIGFCADLFTGGEEDPSVSQAMGEALAACQAIGATVVDMPFPHADRAAELWGELLFAEAANMLNDVMRTHGSADFNTLFDNYLAAYATLDLGGYLKAMAERTQIQRKVGAMFDEVDVFLMPTSLAAPFRNDLDFHEPDQVPYILNAQRPLHVINLLGLPAVAVPTRTTSNIPSGFQIVAPMHDDLFAISVAEKIAAAL